MTERIQSCILALLCSCQTTTTQPRAALVEPVQPPVYKQEPIDVCRALGILLCTHCGPSNNGCQAVSELVEAQPNMTPAQYSEADMLCQQIVYKTNAAIQALGLTDAQLCAEFNKSFGDSI